MIIFLGGPIFVDFQYGAPRETDASRLCEQLEINCLAKPSACHLLLNARTSKQIFRETVLITVRGNKYTPFDSLFLDASASFGLPAIFLFCCAIVWPSSSMYPCKPGANGVSCGSKPNLWHMFFADWRIPSRHPQFQWCHQAILDYTLSHPCPLRKRTIWSLVRPASQASRYDSMRVQRCYELV